MPIEYSGKGANSGGSRGTRADQGVRPTGLASLDRLLARGPELLEH
jgi:hypothetical protein